MESFSPVTRERNRDIHMLNLKLLRLTRTSISPTLGILHIDGVPRFVTLEPPELGNRPNLSCIPEGSYECKKVENRKLVSGKVISVTLEVRDVPGRSGILFHGGNVGADTQGCILVGLGFSLSSRFTIAHSTNAMRAFREELRGDNYLLNIIYV